METLLPVNVDVQMAAKATEVIWNEAFNHFAFTNNELLLPLNITAIIGSLNIERLKSKLSIFLGRPCVAFVDNSMGCVRILARPDFNGLGSVADHVLLPRTSAGGAEILENGSVASGSKIGTKLEKKAKVPRPPNAFILYRKHYHAILKERNPEMHNNEISVTVGNQWNHESEEVKAHYKALAEEAKREHAQKYPNYQYAPRKPCEKKRRNSRRTTTNVESDAYSDDEEENSIQTPCESPTNSSSSTLSSVHGNDDVDMQTSNAVLSFLDISDSPSTTVYYGFTGSPIPTSPPTNGLGLSEFDMTEYSDWVNNANNAQRLAALAPRFPAH